MMGNGLRCKGGGHGACGLVNTEKSVKDISNSLARYGPGKVQRFQAWVKMFE